MLRALTSIVSKQCHQQMNALLVLVPTTFHKQIWFLVKFIEINIVYQQKRHLATERLNLGPILIFMGFW